MSFVNILPKSSFRKGRSADQNEVYVPDYQRELIWSQGHFWSWLRKLLTIPSCISWHQSPKA
jgi:hypothetical protein